MSEDLIAAPTLTWRGIPLTSPYRRQSISSQSFVVVHNGCVKFILVVVLCSDIPDSACVHQTLKLNVQHLNVCKF